VANWYLDLVNDEPATAELVAAAIDLLEADGLTLGRPLVDSTEGSSNRNLKELRPGSQRRSGIRILFAFDPERQAVLLVAGDKAGNWTRWYAANIPLAERRFKAWLSGDYSEERGG
jgi:hypothetical protein